MRATAWLAIGAMSLAACANVWSFADLQVGDGGAGGDGAIQEGGSGSGSSSGSGDATVDRAGGDASVDRADAGSDGDACTTPQVQSLGCSAYAPEKYCICIGQGCYNWYSAYTPAGCAACVETYDCACIQSHPDPCNGHGQFVICSQGPLFTTVYCQ